MLALDTCPPEKSCENTMGSYTCIDGVKNKPLDCPKGYHYKPSIESCTGKFDKCIFVNQLKMCCILLQISMNVQLGKIIATETLKFVSTCKGDLHAKIRRQKIRVLRDLK